MKKKVTKKEAEEKINEFFKKENFEAKDVRKIKRLAMSFNIKLGKHRKKFCGNCFFLLKGKTRVTKTHKSVVCENCGFINRVKLIRS